jgi:3-deoxy-D-manno-octulosonic-acid transferase
MRFLYNVLFNLGFLVCSPFYFVKMRRRGNWRSGFRQRFAQYDNQIKQALTNRRTIWFHAVSVGEVNLCTQLVKVIEPRLPHHKIIVSTTTSTGMAELKSRLPGHVSKIYYPIDRRRHVLRALSLIRPEAMIFVEAELWPNMLWNLQSRGIPSFLVNARISDKSFRGYRRAGFIFRDLFANFAGVGVQSEADAARLIELGCRSEVVQVVGSLKFDSATVPERSNLDVENLLNQLGVADDALVIVGGSTHAGEEAILAEIAQRLRVKFPTLFLVLVPRHQERGAEAGRDLTARGVKFMFRTEVTIGVQRAAGEVDCLLVNTTGELRNFYQRADIVFVGKSLTAEGGQNPIEPAALGKAVVFGPHMQNFPQIVPQFVARNAVRQVQDAAELERAFAELLASSELRAQLGTRARAVIAENQGGIEKTVEMIVASIEK